jgi:CRISPR-associated endonuclease/helicase Cas3
MIAHISFRIKRGAVVMIEFESAFAQLARPENGPGPTPFFWQRRLFDLMVEGRTPSALDLPTGLGKTSAMIVWLIARAVNPKLPTRLVYVVDRRAVVDQATAAAERMRANMTPALSEALGLGDELLPISTLRGGFADNRDWLDNPARPAVIVGTVDMIGSRLLFSGYGVGRGMRPVHAGLLACDSLVMLDEAHLSRPFQRMLTRMVSDDALWPAMTPMRLQVLPLSATGAGVGEGEPFRLTAAEQAEDEPARRLGAVKRLSVKDADDAKPEDGLNDAAAAMLDDAGADPIRLLVFSTSRATAEKLAAKLAKAPASGPVRRVHLLTGARRGVERDLAAQDLIDAGFIAGAGRPATHEILIATSAGEVGVDLDADHMVCDLVPWERMVQRLGRVNRRGNGRAEIRVIDFADKGMGLVGDKDAKAAEIERRACSRALLALLPEAGDDAVQAGPGAIAQLSSEHARSIAQASTPEPLHPALTRPLVEAWSLTGMRDHPGRPLVAPWLRGWVEEEAQTSLVWRRHLPVRRSVGSPPHADPAAVAQFFEAAPAGVAERLETLAFAALEWMSARAEASELGDEDVAALVLDPAGDLRLTLRVSELSPDRWKGPAKVRTRDALIAAMNGGTVVIDARMGGLARGLLSASENGAPPVADGQGGWDDAIAPDPGWRIAARAADAVADSPLPLALRLDAEVNADGDAVRVIEVRRSAPAMGGGDIGALSRKPQSLADHSAEVVREAGAITGHLPALSAEERDAVLRAAAMHDIGKAAPRWQRAMGAPVAGGPWAKTSGRGAPRMLDGYRHEFGSLLIAMEEDLPASTRDLTLHLIAAHHGHARPGIRTDGAEDGAPSALESAARDVALRFARLQGRYGPWGLAWREDLLRAADRRASRLADERDA